MIDVVDKAADLIEERIGVRVLFRLLEGRKEGTMIRRIPSATTNRYMDRTREISYIFQVVVKREREDVAIDDIERIAELLDNCHLDTEKVEFVGCEIYTEPQELDWDDSGFHIYEARFKALVNR